MVDAVPSILLAAIQGGIRVSQFVHRSHVYDFVGGGKELMTDKANHLLTALGLEIVAGDNQ